MVEGSIFRQSPFVVTPPRFTPDPSLSPSRLTPGPSLQTQALRLPQLCANLRGDSPPPPRPSSPHSGLSLWSRPRREELPQPYVLSFQPQPQVEGPGTGRRDQTPRRHAAFVWLQLVCLPLFPPLRRPHASPRPRPPPPHSCSKSKAAAHMKCF